jgi:hypothetical protein
MHSNFGDILLNEGVGRIYHGVASGEVFEACLHTCYIMSGLALGNTYIARYELMKGSIRSRS